MEDRLALAIETFFSPDSATVVVSPGSDLFLTKVVGDELWVSESSTFVDRKVITDISVRGSLEVTSGVLKDNTGSAAIQADNAPMYGPNETVFSLSKTLVVGDRELFGEFSLKQPDGTRTTWSFTNWNRNTATPQYDVAQITITSGPGYGGTRKWFAPGGDPTSFQQAKVGYYVPAAVELIDNVGQDTGQIAERSASLRITWSPTTGDLAPIHELAMDQVTYQYFTDFSAEFPISPAPQRDVSLQPSVRSTDAQFKLPGVTHSGSLGLVPGTLAGDIQIDCAGGSRSLPFLTTSSDGVLRFPGSPLPDLTLGRVRTADNSFIYVTGTYSPDGTVSLTFDARLISRQFVLGGGFVDVISGPIANVNPGRVRLSVKYAVQATGLDPSEVTVFAGHDISNAVDINVLPPGSSVRIDSPVIQQVSASAERDVQVRASNITFDSQVVADHAVRVGKPGAGSVGNTLQAARAIAQVVNGQVARLVPVVGSEGAGYDADRPPLVVIGPPQSIAATARLARVNGRVTEINISASGSGYTTAPVVTISRPDQANGVQATAIAVLQGERVTAITITDPGSGYSVVPTVTIAPPPAQTVPGLPVGEQAVATAIIAGDIVAIAVPTGGFGYTTTPRVTITSSTGGNGATARATLDNGVVTGITMLSGGTNYRFDDSTTITIDPPPPIANPDVAVFEAIVDGNGRITGYRQIRAGSGYGNVPAVTVDPPPASLLGTANAEINTAARISAGQVTGVEAAADWVVVSLDNGGSGYVTTPAVRLAAPQGGGAAATATAVVVNGVVRGIRLSTAGSGYRVGEVVAVDIDAPAGPGGVRAVAGGKATAGYGHRTTPIVTVAPPTARTGGRQATAAATIDPEGRIDGFAVTDPGSGYGAVPRVFVSAPNPIGTLENVAFNAAVAADVFRVEVADDPHTLPRRGQVFVSQTSSLSRGVGQRARELYVGAEQSDVVVEGEINVANQTFYLPSPPDVQDLAPFVFTTDSRAGERTGQIAGGTVQVILANDLPTPANDEAAAFNVVDLNTDVASLRVRAATRAGVERRDPFPYQIQIAESNDLSVDAVAASSFPIGVTVGGDLLFNASLATAGGLVLDAQGDFALSAPVTTTRGEIRIDADNIRLGNSLEVTQADRDANRTDILLTARGGDIGVNSLVSAVNGVKLVQRNAAGGGSIQQTIRRYGGAAIPIPDRDRASATIVNDTALDDFVFERIQVGVNIRHPNVGDLIGTLIAPDNRRIVLFRSHGGSGNDYIDTIFDSAAAQPISAAAPPFTGTFRPDEPLTPLFNGNARGTWRLEVQDVASGQVGTIEDFELIFYRRVPVASTIAGTGRVRADAVIIDADGSVGAAEAFPADPSAVLRTTVGQLTAQVGGGIAIEDTGRISIPTLTAGGLVSLRSLGVDGDANGQPAIPALKARLVGVSAVDVSAPNGSVDVVLDTPTDVVVGNAKAFQFDLARSMTAAGNVKIRTTGGSSQSTILVHDAPVAGSGARQVRGVLTAPLSAAYDAKTPGLFPSTIDALASGALQVPDVANLRVGDRILVAGGVAGAAGNQANGVYVVSSVGGATSTWRLTRASDSDSTTELPSNSFVRVSDGSRVTRMYQLRYTPTDTQPFARTPIQASPLALVTDIGSDDPRDTVSFVVTSDRGRAFDAGSLGKMILLAGTNNSLQRRDLRFASSLGTIRLLEELDAIARPIDIDGNRRFNVGYGSGGPIFVDGSRVEKTFDGVPVTATTPYQGFRLIAGADDSRLANLHVGGFTNDAAVNLAGTKRVIVEDLTIGSSPSGARVSNRIGIVVGGDSSDVSLLDSTIVSSSDAGVRVEGSATNVFLTGLVIGQANRDNQTGAVVRSTGITRIGAVPVLNVTATAVAGSSILTVPSGFPIDRVFIGQDVADAPATLPAGTRVLAIDQANRRVTLSAQATRSGPMTVEFRANRNVVEFNRDGIVLEDGANSLVNTSVREHVRDGVVITGGTYTIGDSPTRSTSSNEITDNGRWGLNIATAVSPANPQADGRRVQGNYLGVTRANAMALNDVGNVAIGGAAARADLGFNPRRSGLDVHGNLHGPGPAEPTVHVSIPGDNLPTDLNPAVDLVEAKGAAARVAAIEIQLEDDADAINDAGITAAAFAVRFTRTITETNWDAASVERWTAGNQYRFRYDAIGNRAFIESADGQLLPAGAYRIEIVRAAVRDQVGNQVLANGLAGTGTTAVIVRLDPDVVDPGDPTDPTTLTIGPAAPGQTLFVPATTEATRDIRIINDGDIVIQGLIQATGAGKRIMVESTNGRVIFEPAGNFIASAVELKAADNSDLVVGPDVVIRSAIVTNGGLAIKSTGRVRQALPSGTFTGGITARSLVVTAQGRSVRLENANNQVDDFAASAPASVSFVNSRGFRVVGSGVSAGTVADVDGEILLSALTGDLEIAARLNAPGDVALLRAPGGRCIRLPGFINGVQTLIEEDSAGSRVTGGFVVSTFARLAEAAARINALGPNATYQIFVAASFQLQSPVVFSRSVAISGRSSGFTLSGSTAAADGLVFNNANAAIGSSVSNLMFSGFKGTAITVNAARNVAVRAITVSNSGTGLLLTGNVTGSLVRGSTFRNVGVGLRLQGAQGATIGGTAAAQRNRIEGATTAGVVATGNCTNTQIIGMTFASTPRTPTNFVTTGVRGLKISGTISPR